MTDSYAINVMENMLLTGVLVALPVLLTSLVVGIIISIFQVVTQIQELTLTFVPKILAVVASLFIAGGWMLHQLISFSTNLINNIPNL